MTTSSTALVDSTDTTGTNRVITLQEAERTIVLIGLTDHSSSGLTDADRLLSEFAPDVVCLELCETRRRMLQDKNFWEEATLLETLRSGRGLLLLANLAAATWLGRHGVHEPPRHGAPMLDRLDHAGQLGAEARLADRDLHVTLRRAWHTLSRRRRFGLMWRLLKAISPWPRRQTVEADEPLLQTMGRAFSDQVPEVREVLIEESDRYFWSNIQQAEGKRIAAVLDESRLDGLLRVADAEVEPERLDTVPTTPRSWTKHALIMLVVLTGLFALVISRGGQLPLADMFWAWVLPNSILTGSFAALGGARLGSILAGMLVAPITPLSPAIRSGIVVGLVEAWLRKPVVRDVESVPRDVRRLNTLYKNRMTRVLLVAWLAHSGSSLGNYAGALLVMWTVT
ncbi:MAG: hypothetical protein QNK37_10035 [Acidobacteriota bacterium]|nr:hypothetical protein [Acidobacteriota bacterium]